MPKFRVTLEFELDDTIHPSEWDWDRIILHDNEGVDVKVEEI